jgi:hypothetical protein
MIRTSRAFPGKFAIRIVLDPAKGRGLIGTVLGTSLTVRSVIEKEDPQVPKNADQPRKLLVRLAPKTESLHW